MNSPSLVSLELDKNLKNALQRLYEAGWAIAENAETLSHAPPPVEAFLQIFHDSFEYFSKLDWMNIYSLPVSYSHLAGALGSLGEIQTESAKRLSDEQQKLVDAFIEGGQKIVSVVMQADDPQTALANYINESLDTYHELEEDVTAQAQTIATLQSAYAVWYQQTLESLLSKPESE